METTTKSKVYLSTTPTDERIKLGGWTHGHVLAGRGVVLLGPCPVCGAATFGHDTDLSNFGSYSCFGIGCPNNTLDWSHAIAPLPDWWNTDINVQLDGNSWVATGEGFVNLQDSPAGFGPTPQAAVDSYRSELEQHRKFKAFRCGDDLTPAEHATANKRVLSVLGRMLAMHREYTTRTQVNVTINVRWDATHCRDHYDVTRFHPNQPIQFLV